MLDTCSSVSVQFLKDVIATHNAVVILILKFHDIQ